MSLARAHGGLLRWTPVDVALYDDEGMPTWVEHPRLGGKVDVVAIPLPDGWASVDPGIDLDNPGADLAVAVASEVFIIGFPFGETGGGSLGIWVRGSIATEFEVDWSGLPCFLVDSRTRAGQSGSPVFAYSAGPAVMGGGQISITSGPQHRFLGIYSGRINSESDLGVTWRAKAVGEIISQG